MRPPGAVARSRMLGRVESTTTQRAPASRGKLSMRRRSERCAPSVFVALTGSPSVMRARTRRAASSCVETVTSSAGRRDAAGQRVPHGQRAQPIVAQERCSNCHPRERPCHRSAPARDPRCSQHRREHEPRDGPGRVVLLHRRLGRHRREQVDRELRRGRQQRQRCEQRQGSERRHQSDEVAHPALVEGGREQAPGIRQRRLHHAARRATDRLVAAEERRRSVREVGHDDLHRDERERDTGERDRAACEPAPPRQAVPEAESRDDQGNLLLRQDGDGGEQGERPEAVAVQEPHRVEQQRAGEHHRVELAQRRPLQRRIEQVGEGEAGRRGLRAQVPAREPEDRERAGSDSSRLDGQEELGSRPQPPERREGGEQRVDVRGESGHLGAGQVGHLERPPVGGRPHGLHHVAEVEAPGLEGAVAESSERGEAGGVRRHRRPHERPCAHSSSARSERQRRPSTSSLAWAS